MLLLATPAAPPIVKQLSFQSGAASNGDVAAITDPIDSSAAELLVVGTFRNSAFSFGDGALSDSKGNAWAIAINRSHTRTNSTWTNLYYATTRFVGPNHTFTLNCGGGVVIALGFAGGLIGALYDIAVGTRIGLYGSTAVSSGAITPSQPDALVVTFVGVHNEAAATNPPSVDPAFVQGPAFGGVPGAHEAGGIAYQLQQGAPISADATWDLGGAATANQSPGFAVISSFKAA